MARFQFVQCELQHSQRIVQPGPHDGLSCLQLGSDLRRRPAQVIRQTNHGAVRRGQTASRRRGSAADPAACSRRDMRGSREGTGAAWVGNWPCHNADTVDKAGGRKPCGPTDLTINGAAYARLIRESCGPDALSPFSPRACWPPLQHPSQPSRNSFTKAAGRPGSFGC